MLVVYKDSRTVVRLTSFGDGLSLVIRPRVLAVTMMRGLFSLNVQVLVGALEDASYALLKALHAILGDG